MYQKITSWFLGIAMFMFGILKFIDPFKSWYSVQIANSRMGQFSYALGISGEIFVGLVLMVCLLFQQNIPVKTLKWGMNFSFLTIIVMMLTGIYVHLHPDVPADVLPLKLKAPYIPGCFLLLAFSNIIISNRKKRDNHATKGQCPKT
ncbi:hypothetical protein [Parasegetibacter sp. NRK P23]|uniref:hypothetical protein n=1 Tax=Parasegetibacter sp. NRK P23 TaxID=2942999 RepID=UPI002044529C|nr:hypothetical protein [Parasegetibacter sp. NRK P23]MCM5529123.1 hypothetical protein [Parasegetibacter sp. NRK P23]